MSFQALTHHADEIVGAATSSGTALTLSATAPIDPQNLWTILPYIITIIGPLVMVEANRRRAAQAARKRAKSRFLAAEAKELRADNDPENDAEARLKALESEELAAEADALDSRDPK